MELRQLAHFVAVAEELHFTRAAARVHVVQSTLSASIHTLEREVGAALFVRDSRRVMLTQAGRALLPRPVGRSPQPTRAAMLWPVSAVSCAANCTSERSRPWG